jgi:Helix-hairpin-helix domain
MAAQGQGANLYRVRAYHRAATTRHWLGRPVTEMLQQEGVEGLRKLPGLGESLTRTIHDLVVTGRLSRLDRLRGEMDPVLLFASVPGIGTVLVEHLHCDLGIATLEELEAAAHDGRLAEIAGIGEKKLAGVIDSLATRLGVCGYRFGCRRPTRLLLRNGSTSIASIASRRLSGSDAGSRRGASIPAARCGCRYYIPSAASGTIRHCVRTPPERIRWARPVIG